jgi:regulatory protein YycI of two-component signal transduction system YycFG
MGAGGKTPVPIYKERKMKVGEIFEKNGKKYIVSEVWDGGNYGFREYEEPKEEIVFEETPKKAVRRKKA